MFWLWNTLLSFNCKILVREEHLFYREKKTHQRIRLLNGRETVQVTKLCRSARTWGTRVRPYGEKDGKWKDIEKIRQEKSGRRVVWFPFHWAKNEGKEEPRCKIKKKSLCLKLDSLQFTSYLSKETLPYDNSNIINKTIFKCREM